MEGVPGCTQSRPGELGSGQCQSHAGASGPEEKAVGGGKEGRRFFLCFFCALHFAPVFCPDLNMARPNTAFCYYSYYSHDRSHGQEQQKRNNTQIIANQVTL